MDWDGHAQCIRMARGYVLGWLRKCIGIDIENLWGLSACKKYWDGLRHDFGMTSPGPATTAGGVED
eukprot:9331587-Karenia_brevis.AAC.2